MSVRNKNNNNSNNDDSPSSEAENDYMIAEEARIEQPMTQLMDVDGNGWITIHRRRK